MPHDLLITNARLAPGAAPTTTPHTPVDIAIASGRIAAIAPNLTATVTATHTLDAAGRFVSPGLVEAHFHLDKALIVERCAPPKDRRTRDHMQRTAAIKHTFTVEDIYARARAVLEDCLLNGVTHMRTQVEVDPNVGLRGWEAIGRLARDYAWAIDLEPCVFLQEGWTNVPGAEANVVAALEQGARVVGGAPRYDTDRPAQIARIFALARAYDADIDIHLDGGHTTDDLDIWQVCDLTDKIGWGGRVAIGHGSKYSCLPEAELAALGRRLGDAGVAVAVLPATDLFNGGRHMEHSVIRGVADANALIAAGANCAISTNNVMNPFTPFGDCSLVRIANLYANVVQRGTDDDLALCFEMIATRAARILRAEGYGIAVGNPADLVVWNARSPAEVIARIAQPLAAFKRGRQLFRREMPALRRP